MATRQRRYDVPRYPPRRYDGGRYGRRRRGTRNRFWKLVGILALAILVFFAFRSCVSGSPASAPGCKVHDCPSHVHKSAPGLGPAPAEVRLPAGSSTPAAIFGNVLVWVGAGNAYPGCVDYRLYRSNIRTFRPHVIWNGPPCAIPPGGATNAVVAITDVQISRHWIVWMAGQQPAVSMWALNRSTGRRYLVARQYFVSSDAPCLVNACMPDMSFSLVGNSVVWSHFVPGQIPDTVASSVRVRRLPQGRVSTLYATDTQCLMQVSPQLSNGRLVWVQARWPSDVALGQSTPPRTCQGSLQQDIMTMDLKHRRVQQLTSDHTSYDPTTNGSVVAWESTSGARDRFCVCSAVFMENMKSRVQSMVSPGAVAVRLDGSLLTWLATSRSTQVRGLDLRHHQHFVVASAGSMSSGTYFRALGRGSGRRVIWEKDVGFNNGPVPPGDGIPNPSSGATYIGIRDVPHAV